MVMHIDYRPRAPELELLDALELAGETLELLGYFDRVELAQLNDDYPGLIEDILDTSHQLVEFGASLFTEFGYIWEAEDD